MKRIGLAFWGDFHVKLGQYPESLVGFERKPAGFERTSCIPATLELEQEG